MTKELWLNLPVKDVAASKQFFAAIGFEFTNSPGNTTHSVAMQVGSKKIVVMLFQQDVFKGFTQNALPDGSTTELLISFDAETREEVDALAEKVAAAGGNIFSKPAEMQGWMYGFAFADLDGHRWNMLYMDMSKLPK